MDPDLIAYLDQRFRETAQQIGAARDETMQQISGLRQETMQRFEQVDRRFEQLEDTTRHTLVLVEELRGEIRLIAEGFVGLNERLGRLQSDVMLVSDKAHGWIEPYFKNVDNRVRVLEGRADRQQGDVMEAVRKLLGRPPLPSPVSE